jgi:hypothetical protein
VNGWLAAINKLIAAHGDLAQAGKAQWLTLGYKPLAPGRPGLMTIDYFQCLAFDIRIAATVAMRQTKLSLKTAYSPKGTSMQLDDLSVVIPAFDGSSADKCADAPKPVNLCPVPPDFSVHVQGETALKTGQPAEFGVEASVPPDSLSFVWEAQGGMPAMGSGTKFSTAFAAAGTRLLTVTAFNEKGCSATVTVPLKVEGASPAGPAVNAIHKDASASTKKAGGKRKPGAADKAGRKGGGNRRGGK